MRPNTKSPDRVHPLQYFDSWISKAFSLPTAPIIAVIITLLAAHGYEIFSVHLTIDEEIHIAHQHLALAWVEQGRWGMALLSNLLPSSVVPVVSIALGVGLLATALWIIVVNVYKNDYLTGFFSVSVAMTLPMLPFTMSFSTLAYGIGFASMACAGFVPLIRRQNIWALLGAAGMGSFAIAVYQPMLFSLAALLIIEQCQPELTLRDKNRLWSAAALLGAVGIYWVIDQLARAGSGVNIHYVDQFVDLRGLLLNPFDRLSTSTHNVISVFSVSDKLFSLQTPFLKFFLILAISLAIKSAFQSMGVARYAPIIALMGLLVLPILADSLSPHGVPLRSGIYFPFVVCLIATLAFRNMGPVARLGLSTLALLAMLGNSVVSNRLYASAAFAYERDRMVAHDIMREVAKLTASTEKPPQWRIEVVGALSWPDSPLIPKRETLGASFFEWEGGSRYRIAYFLNMFGLDTRGASDQERLPSVPAAIQMPSWPHEGWVQRDKDLIIIKFSEYTSPQQQALCAAGMNEFCP